MFPCLPTDTENNLGGLIRLFGKGDPAMPQSPVVTAWARFAKTGAPADYLAYRQAQAPGPFAPGPISRPRRGTPLAGGPEAPAACPIPDGANPA